MIGEAGSLALDVPLPEEVALRRVSNEDDVRAMSSLQDEVSGDPVSEETAEAVLNRLSGTTGWSSGSLRWEDGWSAPAPGAGVRHRLRRHLVRGDPREVARPRHLPRAYGRADRSALQRFATLVHSDSTEFSRPILERSGLVAVSTTATYFRRH